MVCSCRHIKDFHRDMLGSYHLAQPAVEQVRKHYLSTPKPELEWFSAAAQEEMKAPPGTAAATVSDDGLSLRQQEFHIAIHVR